MGPTLLSTLQQRPTSLSTAFHGTKALQDDPRKLPHTLRLHISAALLARLLLRREIARKEREMVVVLKNTSLVGCSGPAREVRPKVQAGWRLFRPR